jgi:hypothetical protein
MAAAAKGVEPLFAELDDFIKDADWEQALATSEKSTAARNSRPVDPKLIFKS